MNDYWRALIIWIIMSLEITFFWWLIACDGWAKLKRYGDNLLYKARHKIKKKYRKITREDIYRIYGIEYLIADGMPEGIAKEKIKSRRNSGYAVDGHVFCKCELWVQPKSNPSKYPPKGPKQ